MQEELISVIVPVYNVENYLDACLESIINQSYKNIEIILLDDGSTDKSGALCDLWEQKDSRIRVIHKNNEGLSVTRNRGLKEAKGKYIAWIDSDDYVAEQYLEILYRQLTESGADISMCSFYSVYGERAVYETSDLFVNTVYTSEEFLEKVYQWGAFSVVWNKLAEKEIYENVEFPVGRRFEDSSIMRTLARNCQKIVVCDKALYYYRHNEKGVMLSPRTPKEAFKFLEERCRWAQDDIEVYRQEKNDRLLFLAAKFLCNAIISQYHELSRQDKKIFKKKYNVYVNDVLHSKDCSFKVKMKYIVAYLNIDFYKLIGQYLN